MVGIIAVHCTETFAVIRGGHWQIMPVLTTPFKFGTIGFFLISGFLLGERVDRRSPLEYFMRRVKRVFVPWLLWLCIMCGVLVSHRMLAPDLNQTASHGIMAATLDAMKFCLLDTAFWFVPNLLICIAVLLVFRRHLYSLKLGAALLLVNLVYVVNIYTLWFPSRHTVALFAFVFYLWLGSYAAQNFEKIGSFLVRTPTALLLTLSVLTGVAAYYETCHLIRLNNPDPFNTLRLSNQIFSIFVVLLIFKCTRATWPSMVDVRRNTFGLYLAHGVVLTFLLYPIKRIHPPAMNSVLVADTASVLLWVVISSLTYLICLGVTKWLGNKPSLEWMVGLSAQDVRRSQDNVPLNRAELVQT